MKKERLAWFRLFAAAMPLLAFLIFVNCYFDPANLFHDVSRQIADSLLEENPTFITSGNMNERLVKQYVIEDMPDHVECLTIGSSTVFGIRKEHVGTDSYYNLGVSSADFYDLMAQFAMLEIHDKKADKIILGIDNYFFDEPRYESFTRHTPWKPYAEYMMGVLDKESTPLPQLDVKAEQTQRFMQMFSITYFQSSIDYIKANGSLNIPRWGVADETYEGAYYLPDGSMVYAKAYEDLTVDEAVKNADSYDLNYHFTPNGSMGEKSKKYFEKLMEYLQNQGTEVVIFLCPVSPSLWDRYDVDCYPILPEVESYMKDMSEKYGFQVLGTFNPYELGMENEAFYDARHIRHAYLGQFFDFE